MHLLTLSKFVLSIIKLGLIDDDRLECVHGLLRLRAVLTLCIIDLHENKLVMRIYSYFAR